MSGEDFGGRMIGALLRVPYEAVNLQVNAALVAAGFDDIRPAHQTVFQHLSPGGSRLTELAERAQITKQSMGYLVDSLEERGYLERIPDPDDRRASIILRTERGWAVERAAREGIRRLEADWADRLGVERMQQLRGLLTDLVAALEA